MVDMSSSHPAETAPIFEDGDLMLSESSAIMEYAKLSSMFE